MSDRAYYFNGSSLLPCEEDQRDIDDDPRGIVLLYELPKSDARYIMGGDSAEGLTGWTRASRGGGDHVKDNSAIEIFRVNAYREQIIKDGKPLVDNRGEPQYIYQDLQVAEFAAPVDPLEMSRLANYLGRVYKGVDEVACEYIFEAWPGCGVLANQEILRLNYPNLWMWEYIDGEAEQTNKVGWRSSYQTQHLLWTRASRHVRSKRVIVQSQHLKKEMAEAVIDPNTGRAVAPVNGHEDRMQAANMCFWAAHKWTYDPDAGAEIVTAAPYVEAQNYLPTMGDNWSGHQDYWDGMVDSWLHSG